MKEKRLWCQLVMLAGSGLMFALVPSRKAATDDRKPSDVPMSRPEDCLAVLDGIAHHASWAETPDGSLLMVWGGITYPDRFSRWCHRIRQSHSKSIQGTRSATVLAERRRRQDMAEARAH